MKKIILPFLLVIALFSLAPVVKASEPKINKVTSYEVNPTKEFEKGKVYLIRFMMQDADDLYRPEEINNPDYLTKPLYDVTVDKELEAKGWILPEYLITQIKKDFFFSIDFNYYRIVKPQAYFEYIGDSYIDSSYILTVEEKPIIIGDSMHVVDFDKPLSLSEIKARYSARDNHDVDLTSKIVFKTDYPENLSELKVGDYNITASVTDSANNSASLSNLIRVVDKKAPKFTGTFSHIVEYGKPFTMTDIFSKLKCEDNAEGLIDSSKFKVTGDKKIDLETLSEQRFEITYTDASGNTGSCEVILQIIDSEAPIITVIDTVKISTSNKLDEKGILDLLSSSNKIPSEYKSAKIESEYFNTNKEGIYNSLCTVVDKKGEVTRYRFKIDLKEDAYLPNTPIKDNSNTQMIIIGILAGALVLSISGGVLFYIKHLKDQLKLK